MAVKHIGPWKVKLAIQEKMGWKSRQMRIIDGGAHRGNVTQFYMDMFPGCRIWCFEPCLPMLGELERKTKTMKGVTIVEKALWQNSDQEIEFWTGGQHYEMSSALPRNEGTRRYYRHELEVTQKAETISIDTFMKREEIPYIHILKADLQGGEGKMLNGAKSSLKAGKIGMLYLEVFFVPMYEGAPMFWDICRFLERYDYSILSIWGLGVSPISRQLKYADALFISKEVREKAIETLPEEWLPKSIPQRLWNKD